MMHNEPNKFTVAPESDPLRYFHTFILCSSTPIDDPSFSSYYTRSIMRMVLWDSSFPAIIIVDACPFHWICAMVLPIVLFALGHLVCYEISCGPRRRQILEVSVVRSFNSDIVYGRRLENFVLPFLRQWFVSISL